MKKINFGILALIFAIATIIGIFFLAPEIGYSFIHRFGRAGIFQILGPALGIFLFVKGKKAYDKIQDGGKVLAYFIVGALLFWAGLFGPNVGFKLDREASIPDTAIYYSNGKVINAADSTKGDYYFKQISLSTEDSAYVVKYGEEPGYNKTNSEVRNGDLPKSTAPRADEDWIRPVTKEAQKFEDGKRSK
jgi:hypothetical protein